MKNLTYKNIPNYLRKYRKTMGLKEKDVAKIFGLKSTSMISRWEKRNHPPKILVNIFCLAALYRTSVDALFIDLLRACRDYIHKMEEEVFGNKSEKPNERKH